MHVLSAIIGTIGFGYVALRMWLDNRLRYGPKFAAPLGFSLWALASLTVILRWDIQFQFALGATGLILLLLCLVDLARKRRESRH